MRNRLVVVAVVALVWGAAFYGSLLLAKADLGSTKILCGPWGCLPNTAPLLSVHAMWFTLIAGGTWLSRLAIPILRDPLTWAALGIFGVLGCLLLLGWDAASYINRSGGAEYLGQRALFRLVTWTDLPFIQWISCCGVHWWVTRRMAKAARMNASPDRAAASRVTDVATSQ